MLISRKMRRLFAVLIAITMLLPVVTMFAGKFVKNEVSAANRLNEDDKRVIDEIPNMTGVPAEEIIKLKNEGKTWNEVLDLLKNKNNKETTDEKNKKSEVLARVGMDGDCIKKLELEGYSASKITDARMLVDRIIYQLQEITNTNDYTASAPPPVTGSDLLTEDKNDITPYSNLLSKMDTNIAVYLLIKLEKDFVSMEKVLDEYMYSLQVGVDLEKYLIDKKAYEKEKQEKSMDIDMQNLITMTVIEEKMLEKIQAQNGLNNKKADDKNKTAVPGNECEPQSGIEPEPTAVSPLSDVGDVRPENPLDEEMKEINNIKNRSLGVLNEKGEINP